jgi:hypothetical protein
MFLFFWCSAPLYYECEAYIQQIKRTRLYIFYFIMVCVIKINSESFMLILYKVVQISLETHFEIPTG